MSCLSCNYILAIYTIIGDFLDYKPNLNIRTSNFEVRKTDLELFLLSVEVDLDDEVAVEELARDVGAGPHLGAEVEDEPVGLHGG